MGFQQDPTIAVPHLGLAELGLYTDAAIAPANYEWVLVNRDVASSPKTGDIQNVNVDSADDFNASYSILGDLKDSTGDMTDENFKIDGKYKFRLIPYLSSDTQLAADNTTRFIEWTQESNPTTNVDIVTGFGDYTYTGDVHATGNFGTDYLHFIGLRASSTTNTWLKGVASNNFGWYVVGYKDSGDITFAYNTTYASVKKTELPGCSRRQDHLALKVRPPPRFR